VEKKWFAFIAILIFWFGGYFIVSDGKRYCGDGSTTYSTGRGTCSWHNGQAMQPGKKYILWISIILLIVWVSYISEKESSILKEEKKNLYPEQFKGFAVDIPEEVIIQLLMRSDDPAKEIDGLLNVLLLNKAKAKRLIDVAIERKKRFIINQ
jgi:hypothetical protein